MGNNSVKCSIKKDEEHGSRGRMMVSHTTTNRNPGVQRQAHTGLFALCTQITSNSQALKPTLSHW